LIPEHLKVFKNKLNSNAGFLSGYFYKEHMDMGSFNSTTFGAVLDL
jgi:hypothetical protein